MMWNVERVLLLVSYIDAKYNTHKYIYIYRLYISYINIGINKRESKILGWQNWMRGGGGLKLLKAENEWGLWLE